jgi:hypothetical protein
VEKQVSNQNAQLLSIQTILQELGIDAYLRTVSSDRALATLGIEIKTGTHESNLLEICEIPIPDSELFLLQWFVQLPLCEPFTPADAIPDFQIPEVLIFCAELNQILPVGIFNVYDKRLCFRHIFTCEFVSPSQVAYLLQTIEGCIQRVQPLLQQVAIGLLSGEQAIEQIDSLFSKKEPADTSSETTPKLHNNKVDSTEFEHPTEGEVSFSIDDLASFRLQIDDTDKNDEWDAEWDFTAQNEWDLEEDVVVFDDKPNDASKKPTKPTDK